MNLKLITVGCIAIVVAIAVGIGIFSSPESEAPEGTYVDDDFVVTRPDVKARPNTFTVMTPEEKVAAEEAEKIAAQQAALAASSTATTTATTSEESINGEVQVESEE